MKTVNNFISQSYQSEINESLNHRELIGAIFGCFDKNAMRFVVTVKATNPSYGYETEIWDILRDKKYKGMITYREIIDDVEIGAAIRIQQSNLLK